MNLQIATPDDSERIAEFYKHQVETGHIEYNTHRKGDFFSPYKILSDDFVTYILVDSDDSIHAVATILFREGTLNGEKQMLGYATDLQVSNNRKAILSWSNHFLPILLHEREKRNCKYVFTVVTKAHKQAYNAFVRPRSPKRKLPRYHLFRRFQMVSLHGHLPFATSPLPTLTTRRATENDKEALSRYVLSKTKELPLFYSDSDTEFFEKLERLKIPDPLNNFILSLDSKKNIVGCVLPWSNKNYQEIFVHNYQGTTLTLYQGLKFFSFLGLSHPLAKAPTALDFKFLTYFYFDNPDIFHSLLHNAWKELSKGQFLTFCHFKDNITTRLPRSYIKSKIDCGLYCLLAPEDPIPEFLKLAQLGKPPEFEPFVI